MNLLKDAFEVGVHLLRLVQHGGGVKLLRVAVHFRAAMRADNPAGFRHTPFSMTVYLRCLSLLIQTDIFAPVSEHFRHPDQFIEELINALDIRLIYQPAASIEYFLDRGEVSIPEYCDQS